MSHNSLLLLPLVRVALLTALAAGGLPTEQARPLRDVTVKAAFVARFPAFVSWPPDHQPSDPIRLCLSPSHPFGVQVKEASEAAKGRLRPMVVRELGSREPVTECHVLYVAPQDDRLLRETRDKPILTVGDDPDFCERGGVINLRVVGDRIRFEVGLDQARRVGLGIDPQLLQLATRVVGGRR